VLPAPFTVTVLLAFELVTVPANVRMLLVPLRVIVIVAGLDTAPLPKFRLFVPPNE
jgi:hypothetical protein